MDVDSEAEELFTKKCYKSELPVLSELKIVYNSSNSKIVLWNKYQIFVYNEDELDVCQKIYVPEFQLRIVIVENNFLLGLDNQGNIHVTSLKFKNSQKILQIAFQPREQGIKIITPYNEDHILSIKHYSDTYFLCLHKINAEFCLEKRITLKSNEHWPLRMSSMEKYLITTYTVKENEYAYLNKIFKTKETIRDNLDLVILSFDKLTVYGCLISTKMTEDEVTLVKLYSCPSDINSIEIIDSGEICIIIGLVMGTIIKLSLSDISKAPDIVHLNTALYKMIILKDSIMYTDGITMWKSENTFTNDVKMTQLFIRNTNDFVKCGEYIICTTFTKLIYKFSIEDKNTYKFVKSDEYCRAEIILNNSGYLDKLFEEIDKNNEQVKSLSREQDYITTLSLSNRQDLVHKAIQSSVTVFESYIETGSMEFTLTEDIKKYFEEDTWSFLINITHCSIYNSLTNILSNLSDFIRIHLTISSQQHIIKSTSIQMQEPLKTVNFLIPVNLKNVGLEVNVNVKIIVNIPNPLDIKQTSAILYRNNISLLSEYFIKTTKIVCKSLKNHKEPMQDLIYNAAICHHGPLFKFRNMLQETKTEFSFYVKLPEDYKSMLSTGNKCKRLFSHTKSSYLNQEFSSKEFLTSKNHILLNIGNEKVKINIFNDGFSNPLLKITGYNVKMTLDIRNFFSDIIYNDFESCEPGKEFINYTFYTVVENLKKAVKNCMASSAVFDEFVPLMDQFEKNVIGALPL